MRMWSMIEYFNAIRWWRGDCYGTGHFNRELYEKFLKVRYNIKNIEA